MSKLSVRLTFDMIAHSVKILALHCLLYALHSVNGYLLLEVLCDASFMLILEGDNHLL